VPTGNPLTEHDTFEDVIFSELELHGADLSNKDFVRCTFRTVILQESRWDHARLEDCVFDSCDLTRMHPQKVALRNVEFIACRLTGVDWSDLALNPTVAFDSCNLQYASFVKVNLTKAKFLRCKAVEVNFIETRLPEADFTGTDLGGSNFDQCDLRKADFGGSQGFFADPSKNRMKDTRISMQTAVLLASSFGLRVSGFDEETGM
jgi:fluoroquinolone resistance protein